MEKKTIYYIIGGIAVLGIGYYLYNKSKNANSESKNTEDTQTGNVLKEENLAEQKLANEKIAEAKLASRFTQSNRPVSIIERLNLLATATSALPVQDTGIKGLRGEDRRDFRKETRATCEEKYGSGKDYRQCKRRVKDGGVAFTGDFEGMIDNQFMFSEFENSLDLDL
jgi:hypothetical protein